MTNIDQFESVFKSAAKPIYRYRPLEIGKVLTVTDLPQAEAEEFGAQARGFLRVIEGRRAAASQEQTIDWQVVPGDAYESVGALLDLVHRESPDLIVTYRNLHSLAWKWPYSLGSHLDVLTQWTEMPVVVLPHPKAGRAERHALEDTTSVMAITDHLAGDDELVNHAVHFTEPGGTLYLVHIEDQAAFERYLEVISKIPTIDTESAREEISKQLLKEPRDYIRSCRQVLEREKIDITIEKIVAIGKQLDEYKGFIQQHALDLLVFHSKDEDQLAMHGVAYPLAVELRQIPLLLL